MRPADAGRPDTLSVRAARRVFNKIAGPRRPAGSALATPGVAAYPPRMTDHPSPTGPAPEHPDAAQVAALLRAVPPDHDAQLAAFALLCAYRREALAGLAAEPDAHAAERAVTRARTRLRARLRTLLGATEPGRQPRPRDPAAE